MATAGGLIFYGDGSGAFVAADASNGKLLWHFNTGQSWKAGPMTYTVDGQSIHRRGRGVYDPGLRPAAGSKMMRRIIGALAMFGMVAAAQNQGAVPRTFELKAESPKFRDLIADDAKLEKVAGGFGFTEGPVWDPRGFLYVSDEEKNRLSRVYPGWPGRDASRNRGSRW